MIFRLKEFKTKKILSKDSKFDQGRTLDKDKEDNESNDKQRLLSATSSVGLRSTFYTANQTQSKFPIANTQQNNNTLTNPNFSSTYTSNFYPNQNSLPTASDFNPLREIKSSYSYYRPKYDYSNLVVEKTVMQAKHRELAEKRNQEEMKEFLNEFGISKARFNEEVDKKYDTKRVVKHYEEEYRKEEMSLVEDNLNCEDNQYEENENFQNLKSELRNGEISNENIDDENYSYNKVNNCNIKNLGTDNKICANPHEVKVSIKLKEKSINNTKSTWNIFASADKIPSELTVRLKSVDPVFNARQTYSKMLDIKEVDNPKTDYINHYNPMSAYDNSNVQVLSVSPKPGVNKVRPKTGYEFVRDNFENDNLLKQRKTLNNFKLNDYTRLKDTLIKYNNTGVCFHSLKSAFQPSTEEVQYPKFFLPSSGFGILSRPVEAVGKGKKRVKSSVKKKK